MCVGKIQNKLCASQHPPRVKRRKFNFTNFSLLNAQLRMLDYNVVLNYIIMCYLLTALVSLLAYKTYDT